MFQTITEQIAVVGIYHNGQFVPKKFKWRQKTYTITEITLQTDCKDGGVLQRFYSVMSNHTLYRLLFNRQTEHWQLTELWCD